MKTIQSIIIGILLLQYIPSSFAQSSTQSKGAATKHTKLTIQKGKENENGDPRSIINLFCNGKITYISTIAGEASLIDKNEFKNMNIPANALSACSSWWGGAGDYFYIIESNKKIVVYQGWQDESQEDEGYHWKKIKEINN